MTMEERLSPLWDYEPEYGDWVDETKKVDLKNLTITMTRDCNLSCKHCFCGEAEKNKEISYEVINAVLDEVNSAWVIGIMGGEPLLALDKIKYIIDEIIKRNIYIHTFGVSTNGCILNKEFCDYMNKIDDYCKATWPYKKPIEGYKKNDLAEYWSKEHNKAVLQISNDEYHYEQYADKYTLHKAIEFYSSNLNDKILESNEVIRGIYLDVANVGRAINLDSKKQKKRFKNRAQPLGQSKFTLADLSCPVSIGYNGDVFNSTAISFVDRDCGKYLLGNICDDYLWNIIESSKWKFPIDNDNKNDEEMLELYIVAHNCILNSEYETTSYDECIFYIDRYIEKIELRRQIHEMYPDFSLEEVVKVCYKAMGYED